MIKRIIKFLKGVLKMLSTFFYPNKRSNIKIVCIGDSNTAFMEHWVPEAIDNLNWTVLVGKQLGIEVINAGVATGNTTIQMLTRFQTDVIDKHPDYCIIEQGANDNINMLPLNITTNNIATMVILCKQNNIIPIIMNCNPQFNCSYWYARHPSSQPVRNWEDGDQLPAIRAFEKKYCQDNNITLIDVYPLFLLPNGQQNTDLYTVYDKTHCSPNGYRVVAEEVVRVLNKLVGG